LVSVALVIGLCCPSVQAAQPGRTKSKAKVSPPSLFTLPACARARRFDPKAQCITSSADPFAVRIAANPARRYLRPSLSTPLETDPGSTVRLKFMKVTASMQF
jgi:hypothetical protein